MLKFPIYLPFFGDNSVFQVNVETVTAISKFGYLVSDPINNLTFVNDRRHLALLSDLKEVIKTEESLNAQLFWYEKTANQIMIGIGSFLAIVTIVMAVLFLATPCFNSTTESVQIISTIKTSSLKTP